MHENNERIKEKLIEKFGENVSNFEENFGILAFEAPKDFNLKIIQFLYEEDSLAFQFLTDLTAVNYPEQKGKELVVSYLLYNMFENIRIRLNVATSIADTKVFSVTKIFESANWMERETYDFFGVDFVGHPNLKRILNVDTMTYFPLRKEYPLEDQTRRDKDDEMFGRGGTVTHTATILNKKTTHSDTTQQEN